MSLATIERPKPKFLDRFENVWASLRRYQMMQGLAWSSLTVVLGLSALAAADYRLELPWDIRAAGLIAASAVTLAVLWARVISPLRWWTRPRTATEIEGRFPQLGQRIRTVVQYAGLSREGICSEGVTPSLLDALEEETEVRVQPLPLDRIVPWRRIWAVASLAAAPLIVLLTAAALSPEWRIALERTLLSRRPYTTLSVAPGDLTVEQGDSVPISVELGGRLNRDVVLYTRPEAGEGGPGADWKAVELDAPDRGPASKREVKLEKLDKPISYRVSAGSVSSPTFRIGIRYPLALKSFDVSLRPPAYTGVKPTTVKGGDLRVIEGTEATFQITFDSPASEASLVITDPFVRSGKGKEKATVAPKVIPLKSGGGSYTALLNLTKGLVYRIDARTADGRALVKADYKIDVLEDRPPRVAFEQPDEALEVHPIAEVLNRIRVGDDFGLTKAGIVFQLNNGEEQTLIVKDFTGESAKDRTGASLQEVLFLEKLAASPTDSLAYYAFAEDNYPGGAKRTETDLRYLDIRPFKREYKLADSGDPGEEGEGELASLAELIARQRFNLNRASRLAKSKAADKAFAEDPLKIAGFEETLAGLTREFTEAVEGIVGQRIEPLHAAEESMLAAIAALDRGQNTRAPSHMGDALRHLIAARDTLRVMIAEDPAASKAMRNFDRMQAQKIRKTKKEREDAVQIAMEIEKLAEDEDFVYATLAGLMMEQQEGQSKTGDEAGKAEEDPEKKNDEPAEKKKDSKEGPPGTSPGSGPGQGRSRGQAGKKGESDEEGNAGEPRKDRRRDAAERQEKIADKARDLEEKLKKIEEASDLAKARMAKAAEAAEKASGALARGNTKEATETAKGGAAMLHELARQVRGELTGDVAQELAMARDLADELAEREAELAQMEQQGNQGSSGDQEGKDGQGKSGKPNKGEGRRGGSGDLTDAERLERLEEAARTLEHWLKDASLRAEGDSAERIRELLEENPAARVVERAGRIGELYLGGQKPVARREAEELARNLEVLARQLDVLHRGIVAPELAALVEFDKRVAELSAKLKTLTTDAEIAEWHRLAEALIRDLKKAGQTQAASGLDDAIDDGGWNWGVGDHHFRVVPGSYTAALSSVSVILQSKIQDLILKDIVSARDEATPPEFKELVDRYYEVLSKETGKK